MRKGAVILAIFSVILVVTGNASAKQDEQHHPVTICHRTNANTNPYVVITVDDDAVDGVGGHDHFGRHQGPVWNDGLKDQHIKWGDIIPPEANDGFDLPHDGLNWTDEGRAIYDNGCKPASLPTTTTAPTTTTVPPTTTTVEVTTTTVDEGTTTTLSEETTTTLPGETTTIPGGNPGQPNGPGPGTPGGPTEEIAFGGMPADVWLTIAGGLLAGGAIILAELERRKRRRVRVK